MSRYDWLVGQAQRARAAIVAGELRGSRLIELIESLPVFERNDWVDSVLGIGEPPPDRNLPRGGVPYLPAGVDEIISAVRDPPVRADDVVVGPGNGPGPLPPPAHLFSGGRTR